MGQERKASDARVSKLEQERESNAQMVRMKRERDESSSRLVKVERMSSWHCVPKPGSHDLSFT